MCVAEGAGATVGSGVEVGAAAGAGAVVGSGAAMGVAAGIGVAAGDGTTTGIAVCGTAMTVGTAVAGSGEGMDEGGDVGAPFPPPHATDASRPDSSMPVDSSRGVRLASLQAVAPQSITVSLVSPLTGRWCCTGVTRSFHAAGRPPKQGKEHQRGLQT